MVATPLVWERVIRRIDLIEIGFNIPRHLRRDVICSAVLFLLFVLCCRFVSSKRTGLGSLPPATVVPLAIGWLLVAFGEEVLYRGVMQRRLCSLWGRYLGLILASVLFAFIGHLDAPWVDNLILRLPFGLILGFSYLRTRSLLIPVAMHWSFNVLFAR
ncbi:MAG: lysostaphin resistance A-like protein [Planctomycetota bacterium]